MMRFILKILLWPFTILYGFGVWCRNRLYDSGFLSSVQFDIPVISIGNLPVGGTGKTPHIEYLIRLLQYEYRIATMSRGYKRHTKGFRIAQSDTDASEIGDEPYQFFQKYPETVVSVAEDRMTGIPNLLLQRPDIEVVLLDDAFQHRSVKPGLNILITTYQKPFFKDYILPYGRLREARSSYKRADIIIVSKCPDTLSAQEQAFFLNGINAQSNQQVFFSKIKYGQAYALKDNSPQSFEGKNVILLSAIAQAEAFVSYVATHALKAHRLNYPDHHYFNSKDIEEIQSVIHNWDNDCVIVTTEKDATRLLLQDKFIATCPIPIIVVPIVIEFLNQEGAAFDNLVKKFVLDQQQHYHHVEAG